MQVCDRLAGKQSCSLHTLSHEGGAAGACLCLAQQGTISHQLPMMLLIHQVDTVAHRSLPCGAGGIIACKSVGGSAAHCLAAALLFF